MKAKLQTITWVSHNRNDLLKRSLHSCIDALGNDHHNYRFIVAESGASQKRPDGIPSVNLMYLNDEYRFDFIRRMKRELLKRRIDPEVAEFSLGHDKSLGTEGVHRNLINLLTVGERFLTCDDDILFKIKKNDTGKEFHLFPSWSDLERVEEDCRTISLSDFLMVQDLYLDQATFASPGIRGHSIFGGPRFIFGLSDDVILDSSQDLNFFGKALQSRLIWNERTTAKLTQYAPVATYTLAMNNAYDLAPCFPFGRNVDGAFVIATKAMSPQSKTALGNMSILHKPPEDRGAYSNLDEFDMRINDYLFMMWAHWMSLVPPHLSVKDRYEEASNYFLKVGTMNLYEFQLYLKDVFHRTLRERKKQLEAQWLRLKDNSVIQVSDWSRLINDEIKLCQDLLLQEVERLPSEASSFGEAREWIRNYGEMIKAWPVMRDIAKNFKTNWG